MRQRTTECHTQQSAYDKVEVTHTARLSLEQRYLPPRLCQILLEIPHRILALALAIVLPLDLLPLGLTLREQKQTGS